MPNLFPASSVLWRILLLRRNASELLVFEDKNCLRLPEVEVPSGCRTAKSLNAAIREMWKLEVYSLYRLHVAKAPGSQCYVVEALQYDAEAPHSARWLRLDEARLNHFCDPTDFDAIHAWIDKMSPAAQTRQPAPFAAPGWFLECKNWVQQSLNSIPLALSGDFVQCNASSSFSLIRFETDRGAVWFKAVGEPNVSEYALTGLLFSKFPSYSPQILATNPDWNAWLALEADGVPLSQTNEFSCWRQAVRDLAAMQDASQDLVDEFLRCQARDVSTAALLSHVDPFLSVVRELMARQLQDRPCRLSDSEIRLLEEDLQNALEYLGHDGMPDTVLHLDLNPDNVIALAGKTIFLDWAEGGVGHPFLSFAYFLEHFRRTFMDSARGLDSLTRDYLNLWQSKYSPRDAGRTLSFCALVAPFAHAVSSGFDRDKILRDQNLAGYYRSLARLMKRYGERTRSESVTIGDVIA